jgi:surfactin synthase thioesterase subunit
MTVCDGGWTFIPHPRPQASIRLVCFHHSGGGASMFRSWCAGLGEEIEVVAVQLPGRENRFREPLLHDVDEVVDHLLDRVAGRLRGAYAVLGHSLGAGLGYRFASRLCEAGGPAAVQFFASGSPPIGHRRSGRPATLSDPELRAEIALHGGTPTELLNDPHWLELFLPILRADYALYYSLPFQEPAGVSFPIRAFYGRRDPGAGEFEMAGWARMTTAGFTSRGFDGGHFYMRSREAEVLADIRRTLLLARRSAAGEPNDPGSGHNPNAASPSGRGVTLPPRAPVNRNG